MIKSSLRESIVEVSLFEQRGEENKRRWQNLQEKMKYLQWMKKLREVAVVQFSPCRDVHTWQNWCLQMCLGNRGKW